MSELTVSEFTDQLIEIWEACGGTGEYLMKEEDIEFYKSHVRNRLTGVNFDRALWYVYDDEVAGFLVLRGMHIGMLCIHPDYVDKEMALQLIEVAVYHYHVERVVVYEQNTTTVFLYQEAGFVVDRRSDTDEFGKPYPLLYMRFMNPEQKMVKVMDNRKWDYGDLLRIGDTSNRRVKDYLESSDMFVLEKEGKVLGEVVVDGDGVIRNFAVLQEYRNQAYGIFMLSYLAEYYQGQFKWLRIGVRGDRKSTSFYRNRGFKREGTIKGYYVESFFRPVTHVQHYDQACMRLRIDK